MFVLGNLFYPILTLKLNTKTHNLWTKKFYNTGPIVVKNKMKNIYNSVDLKLVKIINYIKIVCF